MSYVLVLLAFAATLISLLKDVVSSKFKPWMVWGAALTAVLVLVTSIILQDQSNRASAEQLDEARDQRSDLSSRLRNAQSYLENLRNDNSELRENLANARSQISRLSSDLTGAREQIAAFDHAAAQRFAKTQCEQIFEPIHRYESIGYALRTGRRYMSSNSNVGDLSKIYESAVQSGYGGTYAGHIFGVINAMQDMRYDLTIDGGYIQNYSATQINDRIQGIYAEVSALGCEMEFRDGTGMGCRCSQ